MAFKAYTDYPILGDGDHSIRQVDVVAYDRDKYARIVFNGEYYEVKSGYIFVDAQLKRRFSKYAWYSLPLEPGETAPTKLQVAREVKSISKRRTRYKVYFWLNELCSSCPVAKFSNLAGALAHMSKVKGRTDGKSVLYRDTLYSSVSLIEAHDGYGWRLGYSRVTTKTLKPYGLH